MKVRNTIPKSIISAAYGLLVDYVPGLTPSILIKALESYTESPVTEAKPQKMYQINEFCALIGVSRPTLYLYIRKKKITAINVCGKVRIPASEYERIMTGELQ